MVRAEYPRVRLIVNAENVGFARANNQGIEQVRGVTSCCSTNTEVYPGALEAMVAFMDEHPRPPDVGHGCSVLMAAARVSCHPITAPGREFWRLMFLDRIWRRATYAQQRWDLKIPRRVEVIKGACLMLRREVLDEVGLLDEQYFIYTEEMDLCYRMLQAGWELWWVPAAVVKHYGEASTRQIAEEMYVQLYRSKVQFHRKFGGEERRCTSGHCSGSHMFRAGLWPAWADL